MSENAPLDIDAIKFSAFSKAYLELVEELMTKKISGLKSCDIAMQLVCNYMNFSNNNQFAKSGIPVMPADAD